MAPDRLPGEVCRHSLAPHGSPSPGLCRNTGIRVTLFHHCGDGTPIVPREQQLASTLDTFMQARGWEMKPMEIQVLVTSEKLLRDTQGA